MNANNSMSVLRKASADQVVTDPYPFIVIDDALPDALCDALICEYPNLGVLGVDAQQNNSRWSVPAYEVAQNASIARVWREFVAYHASRAFYDEVIDLFGEHIVRMYPHAFPNVAALRALRVGIRDDDETADLLLDAQISGNTAVREASSVKTIHIDSEHKLFTGLLYLRDPRDDSTGGDLDVLRFRKDLTPAQWRRRYDGMFIDDEYVEPVLRVPYARNTLILFVNGPNSLHGVTVRQPTDHLRLFLNIVGETRVKLFDVPQHWQRRVAKLPRLIKKRLLGVVGA
ncbi:MAG TPA: hypothetical protein VFG38_15125 [Pseudomonadales bacterium]|nr:hypothetical protein [Pseudomonadales bacterium]